MTSSYMLIILFLGQPVYSQGQEQAPEQSQYNMSQSMMPTTQQAPQYTNAQYRYNAPPQQQQWAGNNPEYMNYQQQSAGQYPPNQTG